MAADICWCIANWPKDRPSFLECLIGTKAYKEFIDG